MTPEYRLGTSDEHEFLILILVPPGEHFNPNVDLAMIRCARMSEQLPMQDGTVAHLYMFRSEKHRQEGEKVLAGFCWKRVGA